MDAAKMAALRQGTGMEGAARMAALWREKRGAARMEAFWREGRRVEFRMQFPEDGVECSTY